MAGWVLIRRRLFLFVLAVVVSACSSDGPDVESVAEPAAQVAPETTTTTTTTTTTSTTTTTEPPPTIEECLAEVPLDVKLGQLLFPVMTQSEFGAATVLAANGQIAGVVVLGSPDARVARDIEAMQTTSLVGPSIIAVDEEGGRVQRLDGLVGTLPSARAMANGTPAEVRAQSRSHAEAIGALGFTMNLAPVLDLDNGTYIRDRSFGADAATVEEYAFAFADGILDAGLTPTAKHFPGHGRGTDSHTGLPTLPGLDELRGTDLQPFVAAVDRGDMPIMIGHLVVPGLTDGEPATLSPAAVTGLLREELGFDGLVMTDALNMDAISVQRSNDEAAELALIAGVDLAMLGRIDDVVPTIERLRTAVEAGRLTMERVDESFLRVLAVKAIEVCDLPADVAPAIACNGVNTGACALANG